MSTWQKVFTADQIIRAEIVKSILEEHDLQPVIISKKDSAYNLGQYEVHVPADNILKAIKIIKDDIRFE
jgi:hypothetical protein